jgi:hypothetical protein
MKFHDELNPKLWQGFELKEEVKDKLEEITEAFIEYLDIPAESILDVQITGSSANYNYTEHSDLDLHLIVDYEKVHQECPIVEGYLWSMKAAFNKEHDISIYGVPVEVYAEDSRQSAVSNGVYSLLNDEWIKKPQKIEPTTNDAAVLAKYNEIKDIVDKLNDSEEAQDILDKVYEMRKAGLAEAGEFSTENLAFKMLRNEGVMNKLRQLKKEQVDKQLSLESYNESQETFMDLLIEGGRLLGMDTSFTEEFEKRFDRITKIKYNKVKIKKAKDLLLDLVGYLVDEKYDEYCKKVWNFMDKKLQEKIDKQLSLESYNESNKKDRLYKPYDGFIWQQTDRGNSYTVYSAFDGGQYNYMGYISFNYYNKDLNLVRLEVLRKLEDEMEYTTIFSKKCQKDEKSLKQMENEIETIIKTDHSKQIDKKLTLESYNRGLPEPTGELAVFAKRRFSNVNDKPEKDFKSQTDYRLSLKDAEKWINKDMGYDRPGIIYQIRDKEGNVIKEIKWIDIYNTKEHYDEAIKYLYKYGSMEQIAYVLRLANPDIPQEKIDKKIEELKRAKHQEWKQRNHMYFDGALWQNESIKEALNINKKIEIVKILNQIWSDYEHGKINWNKANDRLLSTMEETNLTERDVRWLIGDVKGLHLLGKLSGDKDWDNELLGYTIEDNDESMSEDFDNDDYEDAEEMHKEKYVTYFETPEGRQKYTIYYVYTDSTDDSYNELCDKRNNQLGMYSSYKELKDALKERAEKIAKQQGWTVKSIENLGEDDEYYRERNKWESIKEDSRKYFYITAQKANGDWFDDLPEFKGNRFKTSMEAKKVAEQVYNSGKYVSVSVYSNQSEYRATKTYGKPVHWGHRVKYDALEESIKEYYKEDAEAPIWSDDEFWEYYDLDITIDREWSDEEEVYITIPNISLITSDTDNLGYLLDDDIELEEEKQYTLTGTCDLKLDGYYEGSEGKPYMTFRFNLHLDNLDLDLPSQEYHQPIPAEKQDFVSFVREVLTEALREAELDFDSIQIGLNKNESINDGRDKFMSASKAKSVNESNKKYRSVVADDKYTRLRDLYGRRGRKRTLHVKPTGQTKQFLSGPKKEYKDIKTGELFYLGDNSDVMTDIMGEPYTKFEIIDESFNKPSHRKEYKIRVILSNGKERYYKANDYQHATRKFSDLCIRFNNCELLEDGKVLHKQKDSLEDELIKEANKITARGMFYVPVRRLALELKHKVKGATDEEALKVARMFFRESKSIKELNKEIEELLKD